MLIVFLLLLIITILIFRSYNKMKKENNYSSKMYLLGGLGSFFVINILLFLWDIIIYYKHIFDFKIVLQEMSSLGITIINITMPLMIAESIFLIITNIELNRKEGISKYNMLGILMDIFFVTFSSIALYFSNLEGEFQYQITILIIDTVIAVSICYYICIFNSAIICSYLATKQKLKYNQDYIIILGCKIKKDGSPTKLLANRINAAIEFEKEQFEKTGKHCFFVTSGGKGYDEIISESLSMKKYLIENGVDEKYILVEDKSSNTYKNIKYSLEVINDENANISIATTNYHLFRALVISKYFKDNIGGISGKTKWYFYPNGFIREFIGIVIMDKKKHIIILSLIILLFTILSVFLLKM